MIWAVIPRKIETLIQAIRKNVKFKLFCFFLPLQALMAEEISDAARKSVNAIFRKTRRISEALSIHYMARGRIVLVSICQKPPVPLCQLHLNPLHHLTCNTTEQHN